MKKSGFVSVILIYGIFLFSVQAEAQNEFTQKMERLVDKLTESTIMCADPNQKLTREDVVAVSGIDLKSVFRRLHNAGFYPGPYTEDDFTQLSESVKRFQRFSKLNIDGILNLATWEKLEKLYDPMDVKVKSETPKSSDVVEDDSVQRLMKVKKVALTEFAREKLFDNLAKNVYESISISFVNKGFQVAERSELDEAIKQENLSDSGIDDISIARKLGKALETEAAVIGNITEMGSDKVFVRARLIDVENGRTLSAAEVEINKKSPEVENIIQAGPASPTQDDDQQSPQRFKPAPRVQGNETLFTEASKITKHFKVVLFSKEMKEIDEEMHLLLHFIITSKVNDQFGNHDRKAYLGDDLGNIYPAAESSRFFLDCVKLVPQRFTLAFNKFPKGEFNRVCPTFYTGCCRYRVGPGGRKL